MNVVLKLFGKRPSATTLVGHELRRREQLEVAALGLARYEDYKNGEDWIVTPENFPRIEVPMQAVVGGDDHRLPRVRRLSQLHPTGGTTRGRRP